jgi:uncharacterized cupredoxin-like copper-binding protein
VRRASAVVAAVGLVALAAGCASSGAGGREIQITQRDDGCTPVRVDVAPGEKLKLVVKNESSKDYEIEGVDGTNLEELVVPEGLARTPGYTVPDGESTHNIKCYVPAGPSTIIELVAGAASATASPATPSVDPMAGTSGNADTSVAVTLAGYSVTPDKPSVSAGKIRFIATNVDTEGVHELAVLKTKPNGAFDIVGEVEGIEPQHSGSTVMDLTPGAYVLACLITIGESGSTVDHYKQGMHTAFSVQ